MTGRILQQFSIPGNKVITLGNQRRVKLKIILKVWSGSLQAFYGQFLIHTDNGEIAKCLVEKVYRHGVPTNVAEYMNRQSGNHQLVIHEMLGEGFVSGLDHVNETVGIKKEFGHVFFALQIGTGDLFLSGLVVVFLVTDG